MCTFAAHLCNTPQKQQTVLTMIWNPNKECMSRDEMSALQGKRLHKMVEYVYHNVPFYRNKLQELDTLW